MSTWILRLDAPPGAGPTIAVKDLIDVEGLPTTGANPTVAAAARPAEADAACLAGLRAAGARIVGKTNLHELAFGGTGINPWYGTPVNPLDPALIPGGSSSGSAVAVAVGEADIALGTDTAGSVRTPSACCGTVGLKTTFGRIPTEGTRPLGPSLDCIGPMARDMAGVVAGMAMLEPGFEVAASPAPLIGRVRLPGVHPDIDRAVDETLAASELEVVDVVLPGFQAASDAGRILLHAEGWQVNGHLYVNDPSSVGEDLRARFEIGRNITARQLADARATGEAWTRELVAALARNPVLAWPTLLTMPARLDDPIPDTRTTNVPVNVAGVPSLALPAPTGGAIPASVQLVGTHSSEDLLCATGLVVEAAARTLT